MNVRAVVESLLEKDRNLYEESGRHWGDITDRSYMFDRSRREAESVEGLSQVRSVCAFGWELGWDRMGESGLSHAGTQRC